MSKEISKNANKSSFMIPLALPFLVAIGGSLGMTYYKLNNIHETQASRTTGEATEGYADKYLTDIGKGWLANPKNVASNHFLCIERQYLERAEKHFQEQKDTVVAKLKGEDKPKLPACVVENGATAEDITHELIKSYGLTGEFYIGSIRSLNNGGHTASSFDMKVIHVMTPKEKS